MVLDPGDPDTVSAGSFFTNPVLDEPAFAALQARAAERLGADARPPAWPDADAHVKTSAAWLIERAGFHRGHGNPRGIAISSKHTLALNLLGTADPPPLARVALRAYLDFHQTALDEWRDSGLDRATLLALLERTLTATVAAAREAP